MKLIVRIACVLAAVGVSMRAGHAQQPASVPAVPPVGAADQPKTFDFAATAVGAMPQGWFMPVQGYTAKVIEDADAPGGQAVELAHGPEAVRGFGNFMHSFEAAAYRGKRVSLKGWIRPGPGADPVRAQMWLRVDRANGQMGFFDNMSDRPITREHADKYRVFSIVGNIANDAQSLNMGVMLMGATGSVRIASMSVEVIGSAIEADKPSAPLDGRALHNVTAFAELYGLVRFFHPSDQSKDVDWEKLAMAGAERVEPCRDGAELAAALLEVFKPIAPTVQVWNGEAGAGPAAPDAPAEGTQITAWSHFGVQLAPTTKGMPQIYRSTRQREPLQIGGERKLPVPGSAATRQLAGGVSCRVPITIYTDTEGRTLPREAGGKLPELNRPEGWQASGNDRTARLAAVVIAWNVMEHFYPYFDVTESGWAETLAPALSHAAADADAQAFLRTLRTLIAHLHDGHGYVGSPAMGEVALPLDWAWVGSSLVVTVPDGAGKLQRGDVVEAVDGKTVDALYDQILPTICAATEQWARWRALAELRLVAPGNGETTLAVRRGGEKLNITIKRSATDSQPKPEARPENGSELAPGIVYFNLDGAKVEPFTACLDRLKGAKGIVFDLRGYPSDAATVLLQHLATGPMQSAKWIIPISTMPDGEGRVWFNSNRWDLKPITPHLGGPDQPVVFVTDGRAISYAESCMGIVEAYKLGEIVGGPTAGTNGNINPFVLPGGYRVVWTGMKVIKHDDSRHHGVGIAPTVPARRTQEGIAAGKDELLDAAVEVVKKKMPAAR